MHFNACRIHSSVEDNVWLGMRNQDSTWRSINGIPVTEDQWVTDQPDETLLPACAILDEAEAYMWSDEPCTNTNSVLCEPMGLYL